MGHQANHGILGTIGGAIIGSIAEDKLKKRKEEKKQEEQYGHGHSHHHHSQYDGSSSGSTLGQLGSMFGKK